MNDGGSGLQKTPGVSKWSIFRFSFLLIIIIVFLIIYLFWRVQEGKNLIPTVVLKEKSTSAIRRREGSILRAREGAKSQISSVRKKLYFLCEFKEFDAVKVSNLSISVDFRMVL